MPRKSQSLLDQDALDMAPDGDPVRDMLEQVFPEVNGSITVPAVGSLVQEAAAQVESMLPPLPEEVSSQPRPSTLVADALVERSSIQAQPMQKLRLQLNVLKDGGIFGDIDTDGANSLMMSVDLVEAGAWKTTEKDPMKRLTERNPQVSVLPQHWVSKLKTPLSRARAALNDHSYRFPVTDAFIGPSFRFVPWTQWEAFITEYRNAQAELERVKEELLVPETYRQAIDAVLVQAAQRAEHAARSLEANNIPVKDDFIPAFVSRVSGRIPSPDAIRTKLRITFTPGILEDDADMLDYETRIAEAVTASRLAQDRRDTVAQTKAEMRLFVLEALKDRLTTSMAPFEQMIQGFKAEAYRTLTVVREALTTEQYLDRTAMRKVEGLYAQLADIKLFLGDEFTESKLDELTASITAFGTASARTQSPLLAGQLEVLLADMQAICKEAADRALSEETGIGLVDLR